MRVAGIMIVGLLLGSIAQAGTEPPECGVWRNRLGQLDAEIVTETAGLEECRTNPDADCSDLELLVDSLYWEKEVTQGWLKDPMYGCDQR